MNTRGVSSGAQLGHRSLRGITKTESQTSDRTMLAQQVRIEAAARKSSGICSVLATTSARLPGLSFWKHSPSGWRSHPDYGVPPPRTEGITAQVDCPGVSKASL